MYICKLFKINVLISLSVKVMSSKEILINTTLDKVRHFLQKDGGDVEFVNMNKNIVYLSMKGACEGCSYAYADIKELIEVILQEEVDPKIEVRLASEEGVTKETTF